MWLAVDSHTGLRIPATPDAEARCPLCGDPVIPKCGDLVSWHFAHRSREDCDTWSEPESEWHRWWKSQVPADYREVVMGNHRADLVSEAGRVVIELQHSSIGLAEVAERESFYRSQVKYLAWIFDCRGAADRMRIHFNEFGVTVGWIQPRKVLMHMPDSCIYLDVWGNYESLIRIRQFNRMEPTYCSFQGALEPYEKVMQRYWPSHFDLGQ